MRFPSLEAFKVKARRPVDRTAERATSQTRAGRENLLGGLNRVIQQYSQQLTRRLETGLFPEARARIAEGWICASEAQRAEIGTQREGSGRGGGSRSPEPKIKNADCTLGSPSRPRHRTQPSASGLPEFLSSAPALALESFGTWANLPGVSLLNKRLVDSCPLFPLLFQQTQPGTARSAVTSPVCRGLDRRGSAVFGPGRSPCPSILLQTWRGQGNDLASPRAAVCLL